MDDEAIDAVVALLNEALDLLTTDIPDMEVVEWNATPTGRAIKCIETAVSRMIEDT